MRTTSFIVAALAASALAAPASAALILTQNFSNIALPTVTATSTGLPVEQQASQGLSAPLFSNANGVLIGASFTATASIRAQGVVSADDAGFLAVVAGTGEGFGGAALSGAGFAPITLGNPFSSDLRTTANCVGLNSCSAASAQVFATLSGGRTIDPGALGAYLAGQPGPLTATVRSSSLATNGAADSEAYANTVRWMSQSGTFEYEYLRHATASFSGAGASNVLSLTLGEIVQGSMDASQGFSIFNFAADAPNTIGLDLDLVTGSGDTGALTTNLGAFANLAAGGANGFTAFLDSANVGDFAADYVIRLSDADIGVGQVDRTLLLRLTGRVVAAPPPPPPGGVPEPAAWALMITGFGFVGAAARRRPAAARARAT